MYKWGVNLLFNKSKISGYQPKRAKQPSRPVQIGGIGLKAPTADVYKPKRARLPASAVKKRSIAAIPKVAPVPRPAARPGKPKYKRVQPGDRRRPRRMDRRKFKAFMGIKFVIAFMAVFSMGILAVGAVYLNLTPTPQEVYVSQVAEAPRPEPRPIPRIPDPEPEYEYVEEPEPIPEIIYEPEEPEPECNIVTITISAAGDTTLGGDSRRLGYQQFMNIFNSNGHEFFFYNVRDIFAESCLAIVNLEGTLTYATEHMDKEFVFRGPPHFARILSYGAVDVVTIANNHTIDFLDQGYLDTIDALEAVGVAYFGNEFNTILEVNGIKVGLFGFRIWEISAHNRNRIEDAILDLRNRGAQLVIAYHHWGTENSNMASEIQRTIGRFTIASGADLVLGAHPHVIQGIEQYQGRYIVYSLANFSFGGNSNPSDQDTFIFQQTFSFYNGELLDYNETNIIPVLISSTRAYNNFQPTVAEGADAERILQRLETYSEWLR